MLTRAQIQRLAQRHGIGAQAQERDYLQHLLLYHLYNHSQDFIFKGGTALRIAYKGNRYSEGLDFNGPNDLEAIKAEWGRVIHSLEAYGIQAEMRNEWKSPTGYSFNASYRGPLYDSRDRSKGKVRVDISLREEKVGTRRDLIPPEYDDMRPFVITVLTPQEIMVEKVRTFLMRSKARDAYDIWLFSKQDVRIDWGLVRQKMSLHELIPDREAFKEAMQEVNLEWERDLQPLLPQFIPWEMVAADLEGLWNSNLAWQGLDIPGS